MVIRESKSERQHSMAESVALRRGVACNKEEWQ